MNFFEMLKRRQRAVNSMLCVGLDTIDYETPERVVWKKAVFEFNKASIDATAPFVCAYKCNCAFYEGSVYWREVELKETIEYIHATYPDIPVILDGKLGDVAHTSEYYSRKAFLKYRADAVTISPFLGRDACQPFLDRKDKGIFVLCRTSNPGAAEFQEREVFIPDTRLSVPGFGIAMPFWKYIARQVAEKWNGNGNCGLVVGATRPEVLYEIRRIAGDMPILVVGIGAQEGDLKAVIQNGLDSEGYGLIINASRSIIYASAGNDFAEASAKEARRLRNRINRLKGQV